MEKVTRTNPKYQPIVTTKFEGISTHKSDFLPTGNIRKVADFAPKNAYNPQKDERDFLTTNRASHDRKAIPICPAANVDIHTHLGTDGHIYVDDVKA